MSDFKHGTSNSYSLRCKPRRIFRQRLESAINLRLENELTAFLDYSIRHYLDMCSKQVVSGSTLGLERIFGLTPSNIVGLPSLVVPVWTS